MTRSDEKLRHAYASEYHREERMPGDDTDPQVPSIEFSVASVEEIQRLLQRPCGSAEDATHGEMLAISPRDSFSGPAIQIKGDLPSITSVSIVEFYGLPPGTTGEGVRAHVRRLELTRYGVPEGEEAQAKVMAEWGAWYGEMGDAIVDGGNPFGASKTINDAGVSDGAASSPSATGYTVISAESLDEAVTKSQNHLHIKYGGQVSVYETFEM